MAQSPLPQGSGLSHCAALPPAEGRAQQSPGGSQHLAIQVSRMILFHVAECTEAGGPGVLTTVGCRVTSRRCLSLQMAESEDRKPHSCSDGVSSRSLVSSSLSSRHLLWFSAGFPRTHLCLPQRRPRPLRSGFHLLHNKEEIMVITE